MKSLKLNLTAVVIALVTILTGCTSTSTQESTGQYLDNSLITAKVKAKLAENSDVKSLPITVNSYKNTVQLSGFVDNKYQEERAVQLAREVEGVMHVKDNLVIKQR